MQSRADKLKARAKLHRVDVQGKKIRSVVDIVDKLEKRLEKLELKEKDRV